MDKIYAAKSSLSGQNIYGKEELMWRKHILQKFTSVKKILPLKSSLGGQNIYYKKWLRRIKYML